MIVEHNLRPSPPTAGRADATFSVQSQTFVITTVVIYLSATSSHKQTCLLITTLILDVSKTVTDLGKTADAKLEDKIEISFSGRLCSCSSQ